MVWIENFSDIFHIIFLSKFMKKMFAYVKIEPENISQYCMSYMFIVIFDSYYTQEAKSLHLTPQCGMWQNISDYNI